MAELSSPVSSKAPSPPAEDSFRRLFEASPQAILLADDEGRYVDANPAACELMGTPREQLLGRSVSDFVEDHRVEATRQHFAAFRKGGAEQGRFELLCAGGMRKTVEFHAVTHVFPGVHASFLKNVTDQVASESLSRKFRALVDKSPDFIGFASPEGIPVFINPAGLKMVGLPDLAEAARHPVLEFHAEEDQPFVRDTIVPEVMAKGSWVGEFRFRNFATGATFPVHYNFFRIDDPATGELLGIATVTRDITESKRQRDFLEESEKQQRRITEAIPQLVWTSLPDGTLTYFNQRWTDYTGLNLEQSQRWGWQQIVHPDDIARSTEAWTRSLQTGEEYHVEYRLKGPDGQYRWHLGRAFPMRGNDGRITQWFGTCTDIDAQRKVQELLTASQSATERERSRLYAVFMDAPVAINVVRGEDLIIEFTNLLYRKLFGTRRMLDGQRLKDALPGLDSSIVDVHRQVLATAERFVSPELSAVLDYDGNGQPYERLWHVIYQPLRNPGGDVDALMTFAFEVTDQVRARQQTQALVAQLQRERDIREQFVSALTHDLRTPLTAARMNAQLSARNPADVDRVQRNSARVIANLDRADSMIRDLLDANLIRVGERLPLRLAPCDLVEETRAAIEELAAVHGDRFDFTAPSSVQGAWDAAALRRCLENLCNNAVKYGSAVDRIRIELRASDTTVWLTVNNRGSVVSAAERSQLFKSFHRSGAAQASGKQGWGIGLTLVKGVAEAHGGTVSVESNDSEGTTFTLELPRVVAPAGTAP